jgi:glycosyltransferase involved in cell wall biosynthesis
VRLGAAVSNVPVAIDCAKSLNEWPADMQQHSSTGEGRTYVVGCDTKQDIRVFSGITYHLAQQGVEDGLLTGMMNLHPQGIGDWRVYAKAGLWKLRGGFRGRRGFIFTDEYLEGIWKPTLEVLRDSVIINNFQLFGSYFLKYYQNYGINPYFYIDATLGEYFSDYSAYDTAKIDGTAMRQALAAERDGYASCCKLVVMSRRSAVYIARQYDVSPNKIHVVPPGANIPERLLVSMDNGPERNLSDEPKKLVVGFIGLYPERKGLPTIAEAVRLSRASGYDVHLHVIGKCPQTIAQQDGITHFGVIDKSIDMARFIQIVRDVDIGCMLSRAENAGVALLEFLRMGVPIIATDVGGIPDILELGAGQLVSPEISAADLAQKLAQLIDKPDRLAEFKRSAWQRRYNASWRRVVRELRGVVDR